MGQFFFEQEVGVPVGLSADVPGVGVSLVLQHVTPQGVAQVDGVLVANAQAALQVGDAGIVGVQHGPAGVVVQRVAGCLGGHGYSFFDSF